MSDLENRIARLEDNLGDQGTPESHPDIDEIIRKLGLDPDRVNAIAIEKNQSRAEVVTAELGMPHGDFIRDLKICAQGKKLLYSA